MKEQKNLGNQDEPIMAPNPLRGGEAEESQDFIEFFNKNKNLIFIVAVVAIVAIGAVIYINNNAKAKMSEASLALSRIAPLYEQGEFEKALNGDESLTYRGESVMSLPAVADKYGSTAPGKIAALYAGDSYLLTKDYENAKKYFSIAEGASDNTVKMGAMAGLGACAEFNKEFDKASSLYEKAASQANDSGLKTRYLLYAGLNYENAGNKDKAKSIYEEVIARGENSEFAEVAKVAMMRIGTIID